MASKIETGLSYATFTESIRGWGGVLRNFHTSIWLGSAPKPRAATFVTLFTLAVMGRTALITVLPLRALYFTGSAQEVSLLYLFVSLFGVGISLCIPWLVHHMSRRRVFTLAALSATAAAGCFVSPHFHFFVLGMVLQIFSVAAFEICLNLYVMDHVPRQQLGRFEPLRIFFAAGAYTLGPWLGVYTSESIGLWFPFVLSAAIANITLIYFWYLRMSDNPAVSPMKTSPPKPLKYIPRFFKQPRLRLAWFLAVGRSGWWSMFFIYAPIYAVESGLGEEAGGLLVSLGLMAAFFVPLWGWFGRRYGLRPVLITGFFGSGLVTLSIAWAMDFPLLGAGLFLLAALMTSVIDGAGNLPFMRAVHPHERPEMTTVYATYRDAGQLAPPGVFSLLLSYFPLASVFVASSGAFFALAWIARFIPKRL